MLTKSPCANLTQKDRERPVSPLASITVGQPVSGQNQPLPDADVKASLQKVWCTAYSQIAGTQLDQFAIGKAQHGWKWNYEWKRVSVSGSDSGVVCNCGKNLLTFASQFPTHTKWKWNLTINHWFSFIKSCRDQILKLPPNLIYWRWYSNSWGLVTTGD